MIGIASCGCGSPSLTVPQPAQTTVAANPPQVLYASAGTVDRAPLPAPPAASSTPCGCTSHRRVFLVLALVALYFIAKR